MIDYKHHSVARANKFREAPDAFVGSYLLGFRDEVNGKMAAGSAVEAGLWRYLLGDPMDFAIAAALEKFDAEMAGEVTKERDDIPALVTQAGAALFPFDKPLTYQAPVKLAPGERFGLRYGVTGYTDFGYDAFDVDLKVTWALPSKPKFSHVCQVGTYSKLRGDKPQKLCYVTPKKFAIYDVSPEELDMGWRTTFATWKRIETMLSIIETPADATALYPLNLDSFYWSDATKSQAMTAWGI
jgi:hypothetical protein